MNRYEFDSDLVDAFVDGTLDAAGEAALADQVAQVLPCHWAAPNPIVAALERLRRKLGGDDGLFGWLERQPGRPRVVAGIYTVIGLLDRFGDRPGVVIALREWRERTPNPPGLEEYLVPDTDESTLGSLSGSIELLLCDGELDRAIPVAVAALAMLRQIAPRAGELDPDTRGLRALTEQAMPGFASAVSGYRPGPAAAGEAGGV